MVDDIQNMPGRVRMRWLSIALAPLAACGGADAPASVFLSEAVARPFEEFELDFEAPGAVASGFREITLGLTDARFRGSAARRALALVPGERVSFELEVPPAARLEFGLAMDRSAAQAGSDGMDFELLVDGESRLTRTLHAAARQRAWSEESVALDESAGRRVRITFAAHPGAQGDAAGDMGGISNLRVTRSTRIPRQRSGPEHPNLLLLLVDTLRADALESSGAEGVSTPHVARLAAEGIVFEQAYSTAPWTMPSVASVFTGLHVAAHGTVGQFQPRLLDEHETLAESLTRTGVATAAFVANPVISAEHNYDQGFQTFEPVLYDPRSDGLFEAASDWLRENRGWQWFAYVHALDPHQPYEPPAESAQRLAASYSGPYAEATTEVLKGLRTRALAGEDPEVSPADVRYLRALYDAEVTAWDASLGRMLERLAADGLLEDTLVVVTSDHGEEFFEHGCCLHGYELHEELVHVPLIFWQPGVLSPGRIATPVSLVDLKGTLLRALDPARAGGYSLFEAPGAPGAAPLLFSTVWGTDMVQIDGLRTGRWKVKHWPQQGTFELFDLEDDRGERRELLAGRAPGELPADGAESRSLAQLALELARLPRPGRAPQQEADPGTLEALRALGYVE